METETDLIDAYGLSPHPEGGWYREFHRSCVTLPAVPGYPGPRAAATGIYFLLGEHDFSAFHRLRSEELWIHLAGCPLELILLEPGATRCRRICRVEEGGPPVTVVPAGALQAARPVGGFSFAACLVAPGFDFADFDLPSRDELLERFPDRVDLVRSLTR